MAQADRDVTILLTLKDRAAFTLRWMSYANAVRFPFKVLIADGGADERIPEVLAQRDRYRHVDYEYVRYPFDADYPRYYAKIIDALSRVDTEFVALADNDDFLVPDAVSQAAAFLRTHADYASSGGQSAMFWVLPSERDAGERVYGERIDWKRTSDIRSITGATARERILTTTQSAGDPTFYDVKRTAAVRRQYETVRDLDFQDLFLAENLLWFLNTIAGKTMRLRCLQYARQQNPSESSAEDHVARFGDWFGRMLVPTWSADLTHFLDVTAAALAEADRIPLEEARAFMVEAYRADVAPALLRDVLAEPSVTTWMPVAMRTIQRLVDLPRTSLVRRIAQRLYRRAEWLSTDVVYGFELFARRSSHAEAERRPIMECLTGPPER